LLTLSLDLDPHSEKRLDPDPHMNECGSETLQKKVTPASQLGEEDNFQSGEFATVALGLEKVQADDQGIDPVGLDVGALHMFPTKRRANQSINQSVLRKKVQADDQGVDPVGLNVDALYMFPVQRERQSIN
jgi:hypothetical protein